MTLKDEKMSYKDFETLLSANRSLILEKIGNLDSKLIGMESKIDRATDNINGSLIEIAVLKNDVEELKVSNSENWKVTRAIQLKTVFWAGAFGAISFVAGKMIKW